LDYCLRLLSFTRNTVQRWASRAKCAFPNLGLVYRENDEGGRLCRAGKRSLHGQVYEVKTVREIFRLRVSKRESADAIAARRIQS